MQITRKSMISGKVHTMELPITEEMEANYINGMLIQNAMPKLTADQREFYMTGVTAKEWDETFGEEE